MERIYFDYAATAPLRPAARAAMLQALDEFGNPSSVHAEGQRARALLDGARREIGEILGVRAERIVFTSGGTEASNLALRGVGGRVLASTIEHDCVRNTALALGFEDTIPVGRDGVVDLDALKLALGKGGVSLVSVMHANNETGVIQPVAEIARICREFGVAFHTDAVQTVGHVPVNVDEIGADLLSFSAHKFGGPKGAGVLVVKPELKMTAALTGGGQERNRRAGTENVWAIAGMRAALGEAVTNMGEEALRAGEIGRALLAGLPDGVDVVGGGAEKVPHVLQLRLPDMASGDAVIAMDLKGVAVSQGSACSSGRVTSSHVLAAMGYTSKEAGEGLRLSWGWGSGLAEADVVTAALRAVVA
jgi:cysteine desulfurase